MGRFVRSSVVVAVVVAAALTATLGASAVTRNLDQHTRFYVPPPDPGAVRQAIDLVKQHDLLDALRIGALVAQGHAVWFTKGTPQEVQTQVQQTMEASARQRAVPVLVVYDVPFRDCGQFSAGGARDTDDYLAWIDGVAKGIGSAKAVVIVEPDGLGLVPGQGCSPSSADLAAAGLTLAQAEQARYDQLNGAVDRLEQQPDVSVYLDATHPAWLNVGDAASRLVAAGVQRAQGFFLNVSNYQYTANDTFYGTWISDCIAYATQLVPGDYASCPNQYWDGGPATNWDGDALNPYQVWSDQPYSGVHSDLLWNTTGIDSHWALILGGTTPTTHFVIDTSRNGLGPWDYRSAYPDAGTAQDWCNPPGRGLGPHPTTDTGNALVDAYLWVKVPGESDGSCNRNVADSTTDPEWGGIVDPAAGAWFPQQALQLTKLANP